MAPANRSIDRDAAPVDSGSPYNPGAAPLAGGAHRHLNDSGVAPRIDSTTSTAAATHLGGAACLECDACTGPT